MLRGSYILDFKREKFYQCPLSHDLGQQALPPQGELYVLGLETEYVIVTAEVPVPLEETSVQMDSFQQYSCRAPLEQSDPANLRL